MNFKTLIDQELHPYTLDRAVKSMSSLSLLVGTYLQDSSLASIELPFV